MDDGDDMDVSIDGVTSKRACDSCRTRKIRCDRLVPCSNCKASKLQCTTTAPAQKAQRQRVHISEEYEKKIDRIEDRLAGIENVLASLATRLGDLDLRKDDSNQSRSSRTGAGRSPGAAAEAATPAPFEGETAINSQSTHARELLAQVVGSNPMIGQNAEVKSALEALNDMVTRQGNITTNASNGNPALINRTLAEINPENLECPPLHEIMLVVERASQFPTMAFAIIFPFLKMKSLREIIEDVQGNPRTCGATRRLLAFGVLHSLFSEFHTFPLPGMDSENYRTYVVQCKIQIEVAMSQLDIFMPATYENIMALLLGSACAVEMCKPSACWVMISVAASLCQNMGYHRYQTMKDDSEDERKSKIHMFWMIYMFDKTMSLRMGRASVIQDWDISLPFVTDSGATGEAGRDGDNMLAYWIKVARVQGQTYEKLFSPAAFLRTPEERTRTAVELVNGMNQAWYERGSATAADMSSTIAAANIGMQKPVHKNMSPNDTELPSTRRANWAALFGPTPQISEQRRKSLERIQDVFFYADVVMHYSTCALIQRAVSPDNVTFNQECLESSRAALVAHMRCNAQFNTKGNEELWTGYIHWSILQAPFTPFIVIFCNAIQNVDATDLPSLAEFVTSLESSRTLSEGADNLYKMCQLFLTVAKLYLQSKTQEMQRGSETFATPPPNYYTATDGTQIDMNSMTQFDPYLSALGLMPNSAWPMAGFTGAEGTPGLDAFQSNSEVAGLTGFDPAGIGLSGGNNPNSVQDWFSGSRYLMNLMEAGEDFHMPDLNY